MLEIAFSFCKVFVNFLFEIFENAFIFGFWKWKKITIVFHFFVLISTEIKFLKKQVAIWKIWKKNKNCNSKTVKKKKYRRIVYATIRILNYRYIVLRYRSIKCEGKMKCGVCSKFKSSRVWQWQTFVISFHCSASPY